MNNTIKYNVMNNKIILQSKSLKQMSPNTPKQVVLQSTRNKTNKKTSRVSNLARKSSTMKRLKLRKEGLRVLGMRKEDRGKL